jgi:hypothetical protein
MEVRYKQSAWGRRKSGRALHDGFTLIFEIQDTCACMQKPMPIICVITAHEVGPG